jgi:hypothetical protein
LPLTKVLAFRAFGLKINSMPLSNTLILVVCLVASSALAQDGRNGDFRISKIGRDLITSPRFSYTGAEQQPNSSDRWLRVEVQFSAAPRFTPELAFRYYILINGKVLTGEVTHANIVGGRDLYSVIYVPPHALAYVMQNHPVNTSSIENIAVQIVQRGEVKDELSLSRARSDWFDRVPVLSGLVLNKNETPFAPLFWDRYEQIKATGH